MSLSHLTSSSKPNPQLNPRFNSLFVDGSSSLGSVSTPSFQLSTAPTSGYVLTSDSKGDGTWQASASGGIQVQTVRVAVTSAQILNLAGASIPVIPAPAAGTANVVLNSVCVFNYGTVGYSGASPNQCGIQYGSTAPLSGIISGNYDGQIQGSSSSTNVQSSSYGPGASISAQPISLASANNYGSGNGTLVLHVQYINISVV